MLQSLHRQGYRAPAVRRVYIPKPGKTEKRPLGVPTIADRALQRSAAEVLSAIYEQDFLPCSFGGRPKLSAHHALATLNEVIAGGKISWVLEADLKNFFGSLSHEWMLRFVEHRVGDPRLIGLIRRWLKAGAMEDGAVHPSEEGTPQGGSISVLLSNLYLHYVLDLWFERVVKVRLRGKARLVRYIDDFVICFQYREDALRVENALHRRLGKAPGNDLFSGTDAVLHAQPEGKLQGWDAHREISVTVQPCFASGVDAANTALWHQ
mgnify:CR=1 FL=1